MNVFGVSTYWKDLTTPNTLNRSIPNSLCHTETEIKTHIYNRRVRLGAGVSLEVRRFVEFR